MHKGDLNTAIDVHEKDIVSAFLPYTYRGFVDVGAHIGRWTIALAKQCGLVVAVEPQEELMRELAKRLEEKEIYNIILRQCACSDKPGIEELHTYDIGALATIMAKQPITGEKSDKTIKITATTLDNITAPMTFVDIVKIDVEGAEHLVIAGARETIKRFNPMFCIECHSEENLTNIAAMMNEPRMAQYKTSSYLIGHFKQ